MNGQFKGETDWAVRLGQTGQCAYGRLGSALEKSTQAGGNYKLNGQFKGKTDWAMRLKKAPRPKARQTD
ncbi:hypothetical protein [Limnobacter sp.]|uniref:hypothetical protein n=1 Tax=Limnobacter sp. TaxID=2003368 RepID=UPI0025893B37|nr:hypothetical protein [Limnobacter sp.]